MLFVACRCSRVACKTGLLASYGVNKFLIKYPVWFKDEYPEYVKHATFYGRLAGAEYIMNLDMNWDHSDEVSVLLVPMFDALTPFTTVRSRCLDS